MSAFNDRNVHSLLLLNRLGSKRREILQAISQGMSPSEVVGRIQAENLWNKGEKLKEIISEWDLDFEIKSCQKRAIQILTVFDSEYPRLLKETADPPLLLYCQGQLHPQDEFAVAIVGSRHPNDYGIRQAQRFSRELSASGVTIVSGCAKGIDQAAHEAALHVSYGRTIAVMGCGLDVDYPKGSQDLKNKILESGALISEYTLGTQPHAANFPKRNRIIAGLCLASLVVQAHERSGSLITAHQAIEEGREVFAVPGSVEFIESKGTHRLLREGACLVESPLEILESLAPVIETLKKEQKNFSETDLRQEVVTPGDEERQDSPSLHDSGPEEKILRRLAESPLAYNELIEQMQEPVELLAPILLSLEIENKIAKHPDGRFCVLNESFRDRRRAP